MPLHFRPAGQSEHPAIETMVIDSFEPVTWAKKLDQKVGPLNGRDWRRRWQARMRTIFATQVILVGEIEGEIRAMSSATLDADTGLAYIDLLAVDGRFRRRGYGREMLRGMMQHLRELGAQYVNLDCLTDNHTANELYRAEGFEEVARHIRWFRRL
jgi:ribosomal protein S18 acetylase RimI-like enzyme